MSAAVDGIIGVELAPVPKGAAPKMTTGRAGWAVALARAGALPALQVRADADIGCAVEAVAARTEHEIAVQVVTAMAAARVGARAELPPAVSTVLFDATSVADLLAAGTLDAAIHSWSGRRVLAEITSLTHARAAIAAGAAGLIAKGQESGGRVGSTGTFILLQQTVDLGVPVWARGGIGLHTAAGAIAVGARGIVLDSQLALVRESSLPAATRAVIAAMDGSETRVIGAHRVYARPDLAVAARSPDEHPETVAADLGPDIVHDLLPIGSDGALASALARRFKTAGGVVQAIRASIDSHLSDAIEHASIRPGGGIAASHKLRYPIAQGPMTRVSDQAAFAAAVADHGGLPFLALAVLRGSEVEPLLAETAALLGDRPWGVGILGFVPPELRKEQVVAVTRARPPVALIAGGRPSQAAQLEDAGIATYLHVPSTGLLDRFVKDGARRFVFEGRECGGHVGPHSSFSLWEAQVERLCAVPDAENLHVLFAGGIHDARSAAAVAAAAAPLAARGARLGVLMGTAYLFTAEAVSTGAITTSFQDVALSCERTALLETAPGHATRCAQTEYVAMFANVRAELEGDAVPPQLMGAQLESLNLGRLRVASKGLTREGERLVAVDDETQRREGMYMLGDVASLRDRRTTIGELHEDVSSVGPYLARQVARRDHRAAAKKERVPPRLDVAIVGMSSMFAGSTTAEEFWTTIVNGVNCITEVPESRWETELYFDGSAMTDGAGRKTPSKWGGFLSEIGFDPLAYGIPPASLASIETVQLLSLEVAARALADAGYADREFDRSRASVIFGSEAGNELSAAYGLRASLPQLLGEIPPELDQFLPALTEDSFPGVLANVIAGRIANRLNLGGMNFTVDAACAAGLAAVDAACKELVAGNSDVVLCGAADVHNGISDFLLFSSVHALSPTGQCRTFDADADGIALGEGIACLVLKRREDAERDGDRIYSIIEAVGGASDGRHLGLTAPRKEGQQLAISRAYAQARIAPGELGLVEAHGTGTVVGDRTELAALTELWGEAGAGVGTCVLGSVKSQIGHTKCTAGLAGLIKASKAIYHGVLPPTGNIASPNEAYDGTASPFRFLDRASPWLEEERHAGVSAFGFGGANFHAVLSSHRDGGSNHGVDTWPAELFLFRAESLAGALDQVGNFARLVRAIEHDDRLGRRHRLRDLAATAASAGSGPVQVAIVASDIADLAHKLAAASSDVEHRDGVFLAGPAAAMETIHPLTAFMYPGQGSQRVGMLADLFVTFPQLRDVLVDGASWIDAVYPAAAFTAQERAARTAALTDTRVAQPALGLCGLAMTRLLASVGITPDVTAGHSYGELVALAAAGALEQNLFLELSAARGHAIMDATVASGGDPGTMAAVSAPIETVTAVLEHHPRVVVANHNSPRQAVISGPTAAVASAVNELTAAGIAAKTIDVACAFHSPLVAAASQGFALELASTAVTTPAIPVWSNTTAAPYPGSPDDVRAMLTKHLVEPVRFVDEVQAMYEAGVRTFVETGPGRVLTQLIGKILGDSPHRAIATDVPGEHGVRRFLLALAELAVAGFDVQTDGLFAGRAAELDPDELPVPAPGWTIDGHLLRKSTGEIVEGSLQPATEFPEIAVGNGIRAPEREEAVLEYLRGLREVVSSEREVMLRYLGETTERTSPETFQLDSAFASHNGTVPSEGHGAREAPAPRPTPERLRGEALVAAVIGVVQNRTGYPPEMLELDLDLEADLSIDSIKRVEIIGELAERIGLESGPGGGVDGDILEALAGLKSLRALVRWIEDYDSAPLDTPSTPTNGAHAAAAPSPPNGTVADFEAGDVGLPATAVRHVVRPVVAAPPAAEPRPLDGEAIVIADDTRGVAHAVAATLERWGASPALISASHLPSDAESALLAEADAVIWLRALHPEAPAEPRCFDARAAFAWWQPALLGGTRRLVVATAGGGSFTTDPAVAAPGLGLAGMAKAAAQELGDTVVRIVDLDPEAEPELLAAQVVDEFFDADDALVEVGYDGVQRISRVAVPEPVARAASAPAGGGALFPAASEPNPVVLMTGGGRGITAHAAIAIARQDRCRFELVGRSPLPDGEEDPVLASALDAPSLRRTLIGTGEYSTPAAVESECSRILSARQIRATLATLRELGCEVRYHQLDVRDGNALARLLRGIDERFGRLDLVVHGAGLLDDHLVRDKTAEGFERVFATKVDAARTLLEVTDPETTVVFFGSVSGVFGNRGQVDYAAANDALDELAQTANRVRPGRVLSIDWGPWAGTGMVSAELEREYSRRGVGMIDPEDGVRSMLNELAVPTGPGQVVIMRARPGKMAPESLLRSQLVEAVSP